MNTSIVLENRETFLERLEGKFSEEEIREIEFAYDLAKEAHRPAVRNSGERYFEHPRAGCLIMMDELGLYDKELIISFLFHDVPEDTAMFGNMIKSYLEFRKIAEWRLTKLFGQRVAYIVIRLTKPGIDNQTFNTKDDIYQFYFGELKESEDVILLKMVDRLHNLRSLPIDNLGKIKKQVDETEDKYISIFESVKGERKKYTGVLLDKINNQLQVLKKYL